MKDGISEEQTYLIRFDGGSRGNPGISGCGFVIYGPDEQIILRTSATVGMHCTNNEAEYHGLMLALEAIHMNTDIRKIRIEGDSLLVVNQVKGLWKVKADNLRAKYERVKALLERFDYDIIHIARNQNLEADALANQAMDSLTKSNKDD